uniref:Orc1-like AAA ATPase domain-containing protein n=1 Tax=Ditylum brightwellii TaxID=49249 RepID=A0A7S2A3M2_9STRA
MSISGDETKVNELTIAVEKMIGMEGLAILVELIPSFRKIVSSRSALECSNTGALMEQKQMILAFQAFVRAVRGLGIPMVLFLDDLQWADTASLDLIQALITDPESTSILFVESYRQNEVTLDNCPFSTHLEDLKATAKFIEIQIANLQKKDVNEFISNIICEPQPSTKSLSDVLYRKTSGNVLLVIQLIKSLWDEGLLWFSYRKKHWEWNSSLIESKNILHDAAHLMAEKILHFSSDLQLLLKKMACLGSRCDKSILCLLGDDCKDNDREDTYSMSNISYDLDIAIHEGIVKKAGSKYIFAHDQIQKAAYELIPKCEQSQWHLQIGIQMLRACKDEDLDNNLFVIVDQVNRGKMHITEVSQRIEFAELNFLAGEKAKASGVFSSAALYVEQGIGFLDENSWNDYYQLWLRLYTSCIELEFCNGNFEKLAEVLNCIITHAKCFDDKLRAYCILIFSLGGQKQLVKAIEMGLDVLERLGEKFPTNPDAKDGMTEVLKTRRMLEGQTLGTLIGKVIKDRRVLTIMEILESLAFYSYHGKPEYIPLFACRMIQLSLRHGWCSFTTFGYALYSLALSTYNDLKGAERYGKLALDIMKHTNAWYPHRRVNAVIYGFVFLRCNHLQLCLEPLAKAYRDCVKIGDSEWLVVNASLFATLSFQCGKELSSVEIFLNEAEESAKKWKTTIGFHNTRPLYQAILNLMGKANHPTLLEGEAISFTKEMSNERGRENVQLTSRLQLYQMRVAYMFGDLDLAAHIVQESHNTEGIFNEKYEACEHLFYDGLVSFACARKTNEDKWTTFAQDSVGKMRRWAENAPFNCEQKLHLLEAEQCFCAGRRKEAEEKYASAILLSGTNGFVQDQALCYERAALFYLENGDIEEASTLYGKAHNAYLEWGARGKTDHLCKHSPF